MISPARVAAFETLMAVSSGRIDLGSALARARSRLADDRDRALAGEIATGTLRWQGAFDYVIAAFANRPLGKLDVEVLQILRLSLFQLLHLDRVPAAAVVKDAVDLAGKAGKRSASGLVNAVLRRVSREREQLPLPPRPADGERNEAALAYLTTTLSHPGWLAARWLDRYGFEAAAAWEQFDNSPAPLTLRVNPFKATREKVMAMLSARGITTEPARHAPDGLIVREGNPVGLGLEEDGAFVIQDEASQLVALYAGARPGERVLDACASPGGKTTAMAAAMNGAGRVVASDIRGRRVQLLARTVTRSAAPQVSIVQADAAGALPFGAVFDRVLLDAPCSGLGTIRRDPDVRWRRQPEELPVLAKAQAAMLQRVGEVLAPGAVLVYATCSSEPEENDEVVDRFVAEQPEFRVMTPADPHPALTPFVGPDGRFRTLPHRDGLEAFFAAMLVRAKDLR
jgi:16S rRNA (cytosine967-C5)-methyltransferase